MGHRPVLANLRVDGGDVLPNCLQILFAVEVHRHFTLLRTQVTNHGFVTHVMFVLFLCDVVCVQPGTSSLVRRWIADTGYSSSQQHLATRILRPRRFHHVFFQPPSDRSSPWAATIYSRPRQRLPTHCVTCKTLFKKYTRLNLTWTFEDIIQL